MGEQVEERSKHTQQHVERDVRRCPSREREYEARGQDEDRGTGQREERGRHITFYAVRLDTTPPPAGSPLPGTPGPDRRDSRSRQ